MFKMFKLTIFKTLLVQCSTNVSNGISGYCKYWYFKVVVSTSILEHLQRVFCLYFTGGYYMFIETSAPRRPGDKARLISPAINGNTQQCMTFYYHMYGPHVKALNVYFILSNTTYSNITWTRQGTQGNRWIMGQVQIPSNQGVTNVGQSS